MNPTVLARFGAAVVNPAPGDNRYITVLANVKIIVYQFLQPRLSQQDRNVDAFVLCAGFNEDINARNIGFLFDADVCGGILAEQCTVNAQ